MLDSLIQFVHSFIITFFSAASLYSLYSTPLAYAIGGIGGFVLGYYYKLGPITDLERGVL